MKKALSVKTRSYEQGGKAYEQLLVDEKAVTEWNVLTEIIFDSIWDMLESMGYDTSNVSEIDFCPYASTYYEKYAA